MKRLRAWWGRRKERVATIFLVILVGASLVFSALIWTGTPVQITVDRPGFFTRPTIGGNRSVADVTIPASILLWTANNELYRLSGDSQVALAVLSALQKADVKPGKLRLDRDPADAILTGAYLQINAVATGSSPIPLRVWLHGASWQGWPPTAGPLYVQPGASANLYTVRYFTGRGVWQGTIASDNPTLAAAFTPNNQATPYAQLTFRHRVFDLPYDAISVPVQDWTIAHSVTSHVIDSFFVDPTSMVALPDAKEHTTLYSDGLRGVRVTDSAFGEALTYLAPSAGLARVKVPMTTEVAAAVAFINQNGGFVGQDFLTMRRGQNGGDAFVFQEIVAGWPLFSSLGQIAVWTQTGTVTRMTRSLAYLQEMIDQTEVPILSGNQLLHVLGQQAAGVQMIHLGYGISELSPSLAELDPVYQIRYTSGSVQYINAQTGQLFAGTGMIE